MKKAIALATSLFGVITTNVFTAHAQDARSSMMAAIKIIVTDTPFDRRKAINIAENIRGYCDSEFVRVPNPSPREAEWIDQELKSNRGESALLSPEYSKRYVREFADKCITFTNNIISSRDDLVYQVALLSSKLLDAEDLPWHMENLNKHKYANFTKASIDQAGTTVHFVGIVLLNRIVIKELAR